MATHCVSFLPGSCLNMNVRKYGFHPSFSTRCCKNLTYPAINRRACSDLPNLLSIEYLIIACSFICAIHENWQYSAIWKGASHLANHLSSLRWSGHVRFSDKSAKLPEHLHTLFYIFVLAGFFRKIDHFFPKNRCFYDPTPGRVRCEDH